MKLSKIYKSLLRNGIVGTTRKISNRVYLRWSRFKHRNKIAYKDPVSEDYPLITKMLLEENILINKLTISPSDFEAFKTHFPFPQNYHGGKEGGVWNEKVFEHFIAFDICRIKDFKKQDIYVDVAANSSPWAMMLREKGVTAFAIDLEIREQFSHLDYYKNLDATHTDFADDSVSAISLQCAFEMFIRDSDKDLIAECARILKPGGRAVIVPLYLHTHYCGYSTADYFNKGYADIGAKEYICHKTSNIPFSRKYDARALKNRILSLLPGNKLKYDLFELQNIHEISTDIYCHYVLVMEKQH